MKNLLQNVGLICLALLLCSPAHAQKTKATILTEIPLLCPIGGTGTCTAANVQEVWEDIVNAIMPTAPVTSGNAVCYNGTTGLLGSCTATAFVTSIGGATGAVTLSSNMRIIGSNELDLATAIALTGETLTGSSASSLSIKDQSSAQGTFTAGTQTSSQCDPGYLITPGSGVCTQLEYFPSTGSALWNTLLITAVNGRAIFGSTGGNENPEIICTDATLSGTVAQGIPVWTGSGGNSQSGCGFVAASRIGAGSPMSWDMVNLGYVPALITASIGTGSGNGKMTVTAESGSPIVYAMTINGTGVDTHVTGTATTGSGNCSPACTGTGGTGTYAVALNSSIGSEVMVGSASGAEGSSVVQIYGGSQDGSTQNGVFIFNATCSYWAANCIATPAGSRLGEFAGTGMSGDGLFTETETGSWNIYAATVFSGTHIDGSYTAPTNMVLRLAPNSSNPERITAVFDYNANLLLGTAWSATSAVTATTGALYLGGSAPANAGVGNVIYTTSSQQGITIQNSGGDTGAGRAMLFANTAGTTEGSIAISATGTAFNTSSDRRLKTDIKPASEAEVGLTIDLLKVVNYEFKNDPSSRFIGFIAQDEYEAFPAAVTPGDDTDAQPGDKGFLAWQRDDSKLVPLLVLEVQSLRKRVSELEHPKYDSIITIPRDCQSIGYYPVSCN